MEIAGLIKISASIHGALESDSTLELTRSSISHFEGLYQVPSLGDCRLLTPTMMHAIMIPGPNSGKIRATLQRHAPEMWSEIEELVKDIKESVAVSNKSEPNGTSSSADSTSIRIDVGSDSEVTVTVKKQKTTSTQSAAATAATSATSAVAPSAV
eukprot:3683088-Amphidinium_carterae.1